MGFAANNTQEQIISAQELVTDVDTQTYQKQAPSSLLQQAFPKLVQQLCLRNSIEVRL